jgi:ankyrin repeat protein
MLRWLLANGLDLVAGCSEEYTPLSIAIRHGRLEDVKLMIEDLQSRDFDIAIVLDNLRYYGGKTAIQNCVHNEMRDMLEYLLQLNACDLNARRADGRTCLHMAARRTDPRWAELLLQHGADPLVRMIDRSSPFDMAVMIGHLQTAEVLLPVHAKSELLGPHPVSGFTSFGKILSAALTMYRQTITLSTLQFMHRLRAVDFIINTKTGASAIQAILLMGGSQRKDYALFERNAL